LSILFACMATPLIDASGISKSYGSRTLFEGVDLVIAEGDRVGVIGPNGAGKTTLLETLAGLGTPDQGTVIRRRGLRVAYVPQEEAFEPGASVLETVQRAAMDAAEPNRVETALEREVRVRILLDRAGFTALEQPAGELSGGWRKRLAVAAALARDPDVLLLDEPTNHLDLEGIVWLEQLLVSSRLTYAVISHDRAFLGEVEFLEQREAYLRARDRYRENLANRARRELEWLSRGPKARTTKAQSRIERAERLQDELADLDQRRPTDPIGLELVGSGRRTKRLLEAKGLGASVGGRRLFGDLDLLLGPGRRLGVVGANGSGKTTLLKILAGEREQDAGSILTAEHLQVVYFDQTREHLEPQQPLRRALAGSSDSVVYRDRLTHVVTWAQRFGFRVDQLELPVGELSGGERARVHVARMMLRPADVLLLDEPTNDLDIQTLEVLEESLLESSAAVVMVTHDRMLLDTVCESLLGLDGRGGIELYADTDQWQRALAARDAEAKPESKRAAPRKAAKPREGLSYREKIEYAEMEATIVAAEAALESAAQRLADPAIASDHDAVHEAFESHRRARARVDTLYERWAELEAKAARPRT
jgi:ATP-binding cassette subfamily F protein uup